jgi:hypothetical protein
MSEDRIKKFEVRRQQLKSMNDEQLKARFWELCNRIVEPMIDYGINTLRSRLNARFCCAWALTA